MIRIRQFRGARPRVSLKLLESDQARLALNCRLTAGNMRPLRAPELSQVLPHAGSLQSIYLFARQFWFAWTQDVDVVRGPIPTDTTERTYFTGTDFPRATNAAIATAGGGTSYPNNSYKLGIPPPTNAAQVVIDPLFAGDIEPDAEEFHVWVYTYVSGWGEEGPPSPPSVTLKRDRDTDGNLLPVDISAMDTAPTGAFNIALRRIYRLNTGETSEEFQLVAEIPVATTTYKDEVENIDLQNLLVSTDWDGPPATMKGLIGLPNGGMAGFDGLDILFCEPFQPHAWPRRYMLTVDALVVGLGSFGTNVVICTEGKPYLATGVDPASMALSEVEIEQACVSKRSIGRMGLEGVVYASPDGLVLIGPGSASVVTSEYFTREEWQALKPESIVAFSHDQAYVAFYNTGAVAGCFIIDAKVDGIVHVEASAVGGYVDELTDTLYLLIDGDVHEWDAGATMEAAWHSKTFSGRPVNPSMAQVIAESYPGGQNAPVELRVYGDGVLRHTQAVTSRNPFRLPSGYLSSDWELDVSSSVPVDEIAIGDVEDMI